VCFDRISDYDIPVAKGGIGAIVTVQTMLLRVTFQHPINAGIKV